MHGVFAIAIKDDYIHKDPSFGLSSEFLSTQKFAQKHDLNTNMPAITDINTLKEFLIDLKHDNKMDFQTKNAVYMQIFTANRPVNTAAAKWEDIDMQNEIWIIPASQMKMGVAHTVAISKQALHILKIQERNKFGSNPYVFPAVNKQNHLHRDSISKAIRNLGYKDKYKGIATSHGFRATFRTICTTNMATLINLGITDDTIEAVLAHKERNQIKARYERAKATDEQLKILLQWYCDYLDSLEPFGF